MNKLGRYFKRARSAITGRFISLAEALKRKSTTVVEKIMRKWE